MNILTSRVIARPRRRGNRTGPVKRGVTFLCGRWWRTVTAATPEDTKSAGGAYTDGWSPGAG